MSACQRSPKAQRGRRAGVWQSWNETIFFAISGRKNEFLIK